ncbi:MBL fold metallo-hydrolase [Candidatus Magnetaquicoccus inordinatus]|uniref:MBL fold metallo-hydrolase n=1 Tax=Candidatus Magnetaquicoccus inordinatus TaxID=2496818 RepID=UPI00102BD2FF|nr:MBL fold metallo-hydrolase [Candidatus Magnetaquicoccus inordinatus]
MKAKGAASSTLPKEKVTDSAASATNKEPIVQPLRGVDEDNLVTIQVTPGVVWLQIPDAGLYILCGSPSEVVKHLVLRGLIQTVTRAGVTYETGPNAILLSDSLVQNGGFANLTEFPVLQMLYRQGMIIPGHPNNTGIKPLLIGSAVQVRAQMEYIYRGNYGLISKEEILACGIEEELAELMMRVKLKFAFGKIRHPSELLDALEVGEEEKTIRNGVTVQRVGFNRYRFAFRGRDVDVDMNLPPNTNYLPSYALGYHRIQQPYYAVLHRGEGDGWDPHRPSMASVIMLQGRIYLIDAAPGVFHTLSALGINISEVEGIFHTHGHDDHFAGLPALLHSGKRLKYYATPLVRAAVVKKFAALVSMDEQQFGQFFDIRDLQFDRWNTFDGLDVMPIYSPHPTETNILLFRTMDNDGYKSYAHWADIASFHVLDKMVGEGAEDLPAAFVAKIKEQYLIKADIKKIDIDGGLIHGKAEDFRNDPSVRLILSHTDRPLTLEEMKIGSETSFGAMDILIPGYQDYLYPRAFRYLHEFFPEVDVAQIRMLLNSPIIEYNVGTIIHRSDEHKHSIDMVVSGTVAYLESTFGVRNHLSFGSLIGVNLFFGKQKVFEGTYRALSHCSIMRFSYTLFRAFLENNGILHKVEVILDKVDFLRKTWLFGEQTSFVSLGGIAREMTPEHYEAEEELPLPEHPVLWLVAQGAVQICNPQGRVLEVVRGGGFFGESLFFEPNPAWHFRTEQATSLFRVHKKDLLDIPIVHWKMLEIFVKRKSL